MIAGTKRVKRWIIGFLSAGFVLMNSTVVMAKSGPEDLSEFVKFSKNLEKSFPIAVYITPELGELDGKPFAIKATSFARLDSSEDIAEFCKIFQGSRREQMKFPSSIGKPYKLDFVFRGADAIVSFRLFNNPDGWFVVSQWMDGEREFNKVFKADKSLIDAIEKRLAVLTQ
jgi:hypothetical protein